MTPFAHHKKRRKHDISASTEIILDLCRRWPGGCTMIELKKIALDEQVGSHVTLHKGIHELIERGLVVATDDDGDRRAKRITVTPAGRGLLRRICDD